MTGDEAFDDDDIDYAVKLVKRNPKNRKPIQKIKELMKERTEIENRLRQINIELDASLYIINYNEEHG